MHVSVVAKFQNILLKSNSCIFVNGMRSDIAFIKPILILTQCT